MAIETEIKLKLKNPRKIRQKLFSLEVKSLGRQREFDIFYDTGAKGFRTTVQVRRLRSKGKTATLTYKGPKQIDSGLQRRLEIETQVVDFEKMRLILRGWGHKEANKSEKIRETFEYKGLKILIDKVAFIGWWIELEGEKRKILKVTQEIGLNPNEAEERHYGEIYADFCQETKCPFTKEMTFEKEKIWRKGR